jgi:hypothetical protein
MTLSMLIRSGSLFSSGCACRFDRNDNYSYFIEDDANLARTEFDVRWGPALNGMVDGCHQFGLGRWGALKSVEVGSRVCAAFLDLGHQ